MLIKGVIRAGGNKQQDGHKHRQRVKISGVGEMT